MNSFQVPNTTPVPNEIINGWAMKLKGSELKVLLLVVRKTLGWIVDPQTGMRKEEDWISYSQLRKLTGLSSQPLSSAIDSLCSKYKLIEIRDKNGNALDTVKKRRIAGRRRLSFFYRLNLKTLSKTSHYFENKNSTVLKSKTATVLKSKNYKNNYITKTTNTKEFNTKVLKNSRREEIDFIISTFKKKLGKHPIDRYPRRVGWNFYRNIISAYKQIKGQPPTPKRFREITDWLFSEYTAKDFWEKTGKLETIRLHSRARLSDMVDKMKGGENGQNQQANASQKSNL